MAQLVSVVEVLVATRNPEHPWLDNDNLVLDQFLTARS